MRKGLFVCIMPFIIACFIEGNRRENVNNLQPKARADYNAPPNPHQNPKPFHHLLTLSDIEKVLGEPVHLSDSSTNLHEGVLTYHCSYMAHTEDSVSKKTGTIYFLFEQYKDTSSAHQKYAFIKTANQNHDGIEVMNNLGDEAYYHSDGTHFYFMMVRKGSRVFNMKVNKITSKTSPDAFKLLAKQIASDL